MKTPKKTMINHEGYEIPMHLVPAIDKKKDKLVRKYMKLAKELNKCLAALRSSAMGDIDELRSDLFKDNKLTDKNKGNMTIYTFDKSLKIEVAIAERIEFNDMIQVAQEKINEYLKEKSSGGIDTEVAELINHAFKTTKGRLDTKRILSLFKLTIKHHLWVDAMELIKKSIDTNNSKTYIRFWERNAQGQYDSISLDIANV